ncbi:MAG: protein-L-isoaspartate(D-aspartate) O-methyltransferase [Pseudomonadales bacterium]
MTSERTRERLIQRLREQGISNTQVLDTLRETPRHIFLDEALAHRAYEDCALPIGFEQTLSQPYIVARMTELVLAHGAADKVLEIGTGSGYQTAVLAQLVPKVYSVERIRPLQEKARRRLSLMQLRNVQLRYADGFAGWSNEAPFDVIISTAAPANIPQAFYDQLRVGGRLITPVGESQQELQVVTRTEQGWQVNNIEPVRFVPLKTGVC